MCFKRREEGQHLAKKIDTTGMPPYSKFNISLSAFFLTGVIAVTKPEIFDSLNNCGIIIKGLFTNVPFEDLVALTGINARSQEATQWGSLILLFIETMGCMIFSFFAERENRK